METEEDAVVVIIVGDDDDENPSGDINIKEEVTEVPYDDCNMINYLELAEKHGQYLCDTKIKKEPIKIEYSDEYNSDYNSSVDENDKPNRPRRRMVLPSQRKSYVAQIINENPELKDDSDALVNFLYEKMKTIKAPPPPPDYYRINHLKYECVLCDALTPTENAAQRHFQDKHGPRHFKCMACGVDFRSVMNLYKHEKQCRAPDAVYVLKARALLVGNKGRHRPFLTKTAGWRERGRKRFSCELCPARFVSRVSLTAHGLMHRGERPYSCPDCECSYTSKAALRRHTNIHKEAQFVCDHCGREYKVKTALVVHMDTHLPLKKFPCTYEGCDRRYSQKMALNLHIDRVHFKRPPPCACQICPRRFARMSLLKDHMKEAHGMTIMTRTMFFKRLPKLTDTQVQQALLVFNTNESEPATRESTAEDLDQGDLETILEETTGELAVRPRSPSNAKTMKNLRQEYQKLVAGVNEIKR